MEGFEVLERMNNIHVDDNYRPLLNIRIKHTVILDDPFEELPEYNNINNIIIISVKIPSRSPSPNYKGFGRLEYEEKEDFIDKMN